jgi:hypothetical protein
MVAFHDRHAEIEQRLRIVWVLYRCVRRVFQVLRSFEDADEVRKRIVGV